jgi:hypothetical protein
MILITVNDEVAAGLGGFVDAVEIRDEQGTILGHFVPYLTPAMREGYARCREQFSMEELKRIEAAGGRGGRTLAEIFERLNAQVKAG